MQDELNITKKSDTEIEIRTYSTETQSIIDIAQNLNAAEVALQYFENDVIDRRATMQAEIDKWQKLVDESKKVGVEVPIEEVEEEQEKAPEVEDN